MEGLRSTGPTPSSFHMCHLSPVLFRKSLGELQARREEEQEEQLGREEGEAFLKVKDRALKG